LNPPKCSWSHFKWNFENDANAQLYRNPTPIQKLTILDKYGKMHKLHLNHPTKAVRLVGVHIAMDRNQQKELAVFRERNTKYIKLLQHCRFTRQEAKVVYHQCYLPTVGYLLPSTTITPNYFTPVNSLPLMPFWVRWATQEHS